MSQVAQATASTATPLPSLQARLRGRIHAQRARATKNGRVVFTVVKLPAPDEFTAPQTIEVQSKTGLGSVGDAIDIKVLIGGYGRSYQTDQPETGEKVTVQTADNTLTVVE
jgi:hypothetical protein